VSIVDPLKSLGVNSLTELLQGSNNSYAVAELMAIKETYRMYTLRAGMYTSLK